MRSGATIYTEWSNGSREFYDLDSDPFQLSNRFNLLSGEVRQRLSNELHGLKTGLDEPLATIATSGLISRQPTIRGFAEDDDGVTDVEVTVVNPVNGHYLSNNTWQESPAAVTAELLNQNGLLSDWKLKLKLSEIIADGYVEISVRALNRSGQLSAATRKVFQVDDIEPETIVKKPVDGSTVASPVRLFGTANDDHEIHLVKLVLQRKADGKFFDGKHWHAHKSQFSRRVNGEKWQTRIEIPPGKYHLTATAIDTAGNLDSSPVENFFSVK